MICLQRLVFATVLLGTSAPAFAGDDPDDLDTPAVPSFPTGTFTIPLGIGTDSAGTGFAVGISGTLRVAPTSPFHVPVYLVIAKGGQAGGMLMTGLRYQSPVYVFGEGLVGYAKTGLAGAGLGLGGGAGVTIPLGTTAFAAVLGVDVGYAFDASGVFVIVYLGPTWRF